MRKAILTSIFALKCLLLVQLLQAQAPQSFSYQAVLRDEKGLPLAKGTEPGLSISLRQGSRTGAVVYNETYQKGGSPTLRSNDFGIITLEVGKLKPSDFGQINWGSGPFFLEVKYDPAGGANYISLSEPIQVLSVPYAIYANYADLVAPENLQLRYNNNTNELSISGGNTVIIPRSGGADADADPKNEHITQVRLNGNTLEITEAGGNTKTVDLSALKSSATDNDSDPKNEHITSIRLNGTILEVSEAGGNLKSVDLNPLKGGATITYKAGIGIAISADNTISNTGDTNPADDITNTSIAQGDVEGTFYKLVVKALAGHPIANVLPVQGQILTWNNNRWEPGNLSSGIESIWKKDPATQNVYYEQSISVGLNAIGESLLGGKAGLSINKPITILGTDNISRVALGLETEGGNETLGAGFITLRDPQQKLSVFMGSGQYDNQLVGGRISLHIQNDQFPALILGTDSGFNNENPVGYISTQNIKSKNTKNTRTTFLGGNFQHAEYGELLVFNSDIVVNNFPKPNVVLTQNPGYEGGTVQIYGKNGISFGEFQAESTGAFLRIANPNSKCRVKTYVTQQDEGIIDLVDPIKDSCSFSDLIIQSKVIPKGNSQQSVGVIGFEDDQGNLKMELSLDNEQNAYLNTGTVTAENIFAKVKNFKIPHPEDPSKSIVYACIEGPEAAAYERGTAQLVNGEAFIPYSNHFGLVINAQTLTVHVTPLFDDTFGLAVVEKTEKGFRVKELKGGKGNFSFDWEVKAVRKGYENYQAVRKN